MRPGQHNGSNKNRNRNRNRRHSNNGNGNSANKVYDSNGPDVKLRGTAQTIVEKYMQLGRDAQAQGDNVAAESLYQHADHYYRMWAALQPAGHSLVISRKSGEDDTEGGDAAEGEDDNENAEGEDLESAEGAEAGDLAEGEGAAELKANDGEQVQADGAGAAAGNGEQREGRNFRTFRSRWQTKRGAERQKDFARNRQNQNSQNTERADAPASQDAAGGSSEPHDDRWEAPSFLQRPVAITPSSEDQGS